MSYLINKTDGSLLTEIVDGAIDQTATDLTLLGRDSSAYGEFFNENLVALLENFANTSAPNRPITGQLWFDTSDLLNPKIRVYTGTGFSNISSAVVSKTPPSSMSQGDFWIDSVNRQLYFNDGVSNILAGPAYTNRQGTSGFVVSTVIDTNSLSHTVVLLYVATTLIGLFSKEEFTPLTAIEGFVGSVQIGFNPGSLSGIMLHAQSTSTHALIDAAGDVKTAESFLSTTDDSTASGTLTIQNETPLVLGPASNTSITSDYRAFKISSNSSDQNFEINGLHNGVIIPTVRIKTLTNRIGLFNDDPGATLDVNGDAIIRGNLTVNGDLTTINTNNLDIKDKVIQISMTATPTNTTADGSGISVAGGVDGSKTLTWSNSLSAWSSSESISITTGKSYKINNIVVLDSTSLGATVTSAPGLSSIGTLSALQVDNLNFNNSTISIINPGLINEDIVITPKGTGSVSVSGHKVSNMAAPVDSTDGVNYTTLIDAIKLKPIGLSLDITNLVGVNKNSLIISVYLNKIYPVSEFQVGTGGPVCRIACLDAGVTSVRVFTIVSGSWTYQYDL